MRHRAFSLGLLVLGLAFASGCGSSKTANASIAGKITLNGQPVTGGNLYFHSENGTYSASIDSTGAFRATDIPPGDVTVTVDNDFLDPNRKTPVYTGGKSGPMGASGGGKKYGAMSGPSGAPPSSQYKGKGVELAAPPDGSQTVKDGTFVKIPDVYKKKETSTVKIKIEPGKNDKDITLTGSDK